MKSLKLIGLALGASFALSAGALAQDITIGVAGPMTGTESAFGRQMKNGAEQAVEDFNAAGGLLGKKLALQIGDDACDPKQARSVAEKFASAKNYKCKNIAILNDKTTYGKGLADETNFFFNDTATTEKMFESYNKGDKD